MPISFSNQAHDDRREKHFRVTIDMSAYDTGTVGTSGGAVTPNGNFPTANKYPYITNLGTLATNVTRATSNALALNRERGLMRFESVVRQLSQNTNVDILDIEIVEESEESEEESEEEAVEESIEESEEEEDEEINLEEILKELEEETNIEDEEESSEEISELKSANEKLQKENDEYRKVYKFLRGKLNEVNLLNAKLLYTNKLFKKHALSEDQKLKVVESFDLTKNVREAKLVYATLGESFRTQATEVVEEAKSAPKKKKTEKNPLTEGIASKAIQSTKPSKKILSEGNELADRFKKLAGIKS